MGRVKWYIVDWSNYKKNLHPNKKSDGLKAITLSHWGTVSLSIKIETKAKMFALYCHRPA